MPLDRRDLLLEAISLKRSSLNTITAMTSASSASESSQDSMKRPSQSSEDSMETCHRVPGGEVRGEVPSETTDVDESSELADVADTIAIPQKVASTDANCSC